MPTELLMCGQIKTLIQNLGYALPACRVLVRATAAVESSMDNSTFAAITLTNNQAEVSASFIRATGSGTIVTVKKA